MPDVSFSAEFVRAEKLLPENLERHTKFEVFANKTLASDYMALIFIVFCGD